MLMNEVTCSLYAWVFESLVHTIHSKRRFIQKLNTAMLLTDAQQFCCGFIGNIVVGKIEQKHNIVFKILHNISCCPASYLSTFN